MKDCTFRWEPYLTPEQRVERRRAKELAAKKRKKYGRPAAGPKGMMYDV